MNIYFSGTEIDSGMTNINVDKATTSYCTSTRDTERAGSSSVALDISGLVTDNNAYKGHGKTAEEVMLMAGQEDIESRRDYMAVMSNSMSDEDFAKLQKEGFQPGSTEIDTVVTIVDHIKAALIQGGTEVVGYTDTLSDEELCEITGSPALAEELEHQFHDRDIPVTMENVGAVMDAYEWIKGITELSEGSEKYMIENRMEPTPENIYIAQYSAPQTVTRQGKGYYADGSVNGYYAKKADQVELESILPQIETLIENSGMEVSEETVSQAKWLVTEGIPLDKDSLKRLNKLETIEFPISEKDFLTSATAAISDGIPVKRTDLTRKESYLEEVRGKLKLEETRLQMSFEANLKLLRCGYQLDTASVEETVELLKQLENKLSIDLVGGDDVISSEEKVTVFDRTMELVQSIRTAPIAIVQQIEPTDTLQQVSDTGEKLRSSYEMALNSYEELMTTPRKDLGDRITKAFQNADKLLEELNLPVTDENSRAVRILGYNQMEITQENIATIKEKDSLLTGVIREMKPGKVLRMIRQGVNPISMKLDELDTYLKENKDTAQDMESYSRFLYKLEQDQNITEDERSAYIGIYRLVHQIEKKDGAPLGGALKANMELTLGNLLTTMRSTEKGASGNLDYQVDNQFGGLDVKDGIMESITSQIERGYRGDTADLHTLLDQAGSMEAQRNFDQMRFEEVRSAYKAEEDVLKQLVDYGQPVTADHLMAMDTLLNASTESFRRMNELLKNKEKAPTGIADYGEKILSHMNNREETTEYYGEMIQELQDTLEQEVFGSEASKELYSSDIRSMTDYYKQMGLMSSLAKEENYEIPLEIGGTLTAINLKVIHNKEEEGRVAVTFTSDEFGKTAAEFTLTDRQIEGYCTCEKKEGSELLREQREYLAELLAKEELQVGTIYFTDTGELNLKTFHNKQIGERNSETKADSAQLYRVARGFLEFVKQVGNTERNVYEN